MAQDPKAGELHKPLEPNLLQEKNTHAPTTRIF